MAPACHLRNSATRLSARQPAATCGPLGADGGQRALGCAREREELIDDAEDQPRAIDDRELVVKAIDVRVDGVRRDAQVGGDGGFGTVVKNAADDLPFTRG